MIFEFRQIAIFPTTDELLAEQPFVLPADAVLEMDPQRRVAAHVDDQFRLLREDMLAELREDLKHATAPSQGRKRCQRLSSMHLSGVETGIPPKFKPPTIALRCWDRIFRSFPEAEEERKKYFAENRSFIKHGSFGCLMNGNDVVAFAIILRDLWTRGSSNSAADHENQASARNRLRAGRHALLRV